MKIAWNDILLDSADAVTNADGSLTWRYKDHSLTFFPDDGMMIGCPNNLENYVLPVVYGKEKDDDTKPL